MNAMLIFAQSTAGKTTLAKERADVLDTDMLWEAWLAQEKLNGWEVVKDGSVRARFFSDSLAQLKGAMDDGRHILSWDLSLLLRLQRVRPTAGVAVIIDSATDFTIRTLTRIGERLKIPSSVPTPDDLKREWLTTARDVYATCWPVIRLEKNQYLADVIEEIIGSTENEHSTKH